MDQVPEDVAAEYTRFLGSRGLSALSVVSRSHLHEFSSGRHWARLAPDDVSPLDHDGRRVFLRRYGQCSLCHTVYRRVSYIEDWWGERMCGDCVRSLVTCVLS